MNSIWRGTIRVLNRINSAWRGITGVLNRINLARREIYLVQSMINLVQRGITGALTRRSELKAGKPGVIISCDLWGVHEVIRYI
jgi:hypothetical protein